MSIEIEIQGKRARLTAAVARALHAETAAGEIERSNVCSLEARAAIAAHAASARTMLQHASAGVMEFALAHAESHAESAEAWLSRLRGLAAEAD